MDTLFDPSTYETISVEIRNNVGIVTLNRPDVLNAFNDTMCAEIKNTWRAFREIDEVHTILLTAAGQKAFCVGIDRSGEMSALEETENLYGTSNNYMYNDPGDDLGPKSCDLWKPVICAVNGMCCGGAFYFLAECDIVLASENASFFDPHVTYGMPAVYEPMKMTQRIPLGEILRLTLMGNHERISADTALRIGLISEVTSIDDLQEKAAWIAETIASQPPIAVQASLRAIWAANDLGRLDALSLAPSILTSGMSKSAMKAGQEVFESGERLNYRTR
ncbi:MAG TPA: enoyl-CoA hydratase/isomerase family protein [Acidimicrobiales bacterium]|jgi:enoyl-CoA hydratase/carnithine racemase|nr:enoyl-CoA hydratase/isomerase family protein [Acidimicrobiales bacterium]HJM28792.1 enoyl-CoA hydratase/isomerase family protein [Acidimicrobiales bacterium]HJM98178.1 enoyl-CoA hydratase/isomerase family protein [Acidimicrobiales bacterium]